MASHARAVLAYARYLGVDPETEPNLLPVAHEALTGPLPPGWERHLDEVHLMPFFYSDEGGFTTWQHPQLGLYLRKLDELRGAAAQKAQAAQAALHQQALHAQQLQLHAAAAAVASPAHASLRLDGAALRRRTRGLAAQRAALAMRRRQGLQR